jgi:Flp pilus assembly pilin Flp
MRRDALRRGATSVEYLVLAALVAVVLVASLVYFSDHLVVLWSTVSGETTKAL